MLVGWELRDTRPVSSLMGSGSINDHRFRDVSWAYLLAICDLFERSLRRDVGTLCEDFL